MPDDVQIVVTGSLLETNVNRFINRRNVAHPLGPLNDRHQPDAMSIAGSVVVSSSPPPSALSFIPLLLFPLASCLLHSLLCFHLYLYFHLYLIALYSRSNSELGGYHYISSSRWVEGELGPWWEVTDTLGEADPSGHSSVCTS